MILDRPARAPRRARASAKKEPRRRRAYEPPRVVFDAPITVQCGVCDAYPYKSAIGCEFPNS